MAIFTTYIAFETNELFPMEKVVTRREDVSLVDACRISFNNRHWVDGDLRIMDVNDNVLATRDGLWKFTPMGLEIVQREAKEALKELGYSKP